MKKITPFTPSKLSKLVVFAFLFCCSWLLPSTVLAARHDVQGCLYVMDTRTDSANQGSYVPVPELPMQVWYEVLGVDVKAAGTLKTNSSGCFAGTLSGFTVPKNTTIKVGPRTDTSDWMVTNEIWPYAIYNYQLNTSITVADGGAADFGNMGIADSLGDDHGVFLLFRNMADGIDLYEDKTGWVWLGVP